MPFSAADVRHLARLARLELDADEERSLGHDLEGIVRHIDALADLDVEGLAPTVTLADVGPGRPDAVTSTPDADAILENAPAREGRSFRVPKILE